MLRALHRRLLAGDGHVQPRHGTEPTAAHGSFGCVMMCPKCVACVPALGIFRDNILRSIVGYNNLCVGFDSVPARYVAMPLLVMQAVLAARCLDDLFRAEASWSLSAACRQMSGYSYLDTIRLKATRHCLTWCQFQPLVTKKIHLRFCVNLLLFL